MNKDLYSFLVYGCKKLLFFDAIAPKCYCTYALSEQLNGTLPTSEINAQNDLNSIMCEKNGGLQPNGKCADDEYCAGPHTLEDSVCGKRQLCTKKGTSQFYFAFGMLCKNVCVVLYSF